jgi:hypothetical protein
LVMVGMVEICGAGCSDPRADAEGVRWFPNSNNKSPFPHRPKNAFLDMLAGLCSSSGCM